MNRYWVTNHFCVYVESAPEYSTVNQMNILTESSERTFNLALRYALYVAKHELKVKKLQVVVNHTYPRRLFTTLHKKYKDNDFLKANGEPMENANEARLLVDLRKNLFVEIDTRKYNGFFVDGRNVVLDKAIQGDGNSTTSKTKIVADSFFRGVKHVSLTHSYDFCSDLSKEVFQKVIAMANPEKEENNSIDETYYVTVMERQTNKNEKAFVYGFCTEDRKTYKRNKLVNEKAMRTKGVIMGHIQAIESASFNLLKK
uniref:Transposase n=1 Tax=Rhabditophanes sp. KR3021 TaxID=114890 RepID=A0AC35TR72_9BILA